MFYSQSSTTSNFPRRILFHFISSSAESHPYTKIQKIYLPYRNAVCPYWLLLWLVLWNNNDRQHWRFAPYSEVYSLKKMLDGVHSLLHLPELLFLIPEWSVPLLIYQGVFSLKGEAVWFWSFQRKKFSSCKMFKHNTVYQSRLYRSLRHTYCIFD